MDEKQEKKHPCPDCSFCQWCSDSRCSMCLGTGSKKKKCCKKDCGREKPVEEK